MGTKNQNKTQRREERIQKKAEQEKILNETKGKRARKQEADRLVQQLSGLGLATSLGMEPFLEKLKHYVETGETWTGTAYLEEHRKYLHVELTNQKIKHCTIRISDNDK